MSDPVVLTDRRLTAAPAIADQAAERRRRQGRYRLTVQLLRVLAAAVWIGSWELTTRISLPGADHTLVDKFFFGQPSGIGQQLYTWVTQGTALGPLWQQVAVTMQETILGFLVGSVLGVVAGVLLGRNRLLADVFSPYIKAANSIPRVVLGALFAISLGLDLKSKVTTAAVLVFFVVFFNAFQGVREVDGNLINNVRILGASRLQVVRNVVIPSALTWIIASLHVAFGFAVIGAIVGEFLGAQHGLGVIIADSMNNFDADGIFGGMIIIGAIALIAEWLISLLEHRLLAWRPDPVTEVAGL